MSGTPIRVLSEAPPESLATERSNVPSDETEKDTEHICPICQVAIIEATNDSMGT